MANPKFPRRGRRAPTPKVEAPTYYFDKFSPKLNKKEDNRTWEGGAAVPFDQPMISTLKSCP